MSDTSHGGEAAVDDDGGRMDEGPIDEAGAGSAEAGGGVPVWRTVLVHGLVVLGALVLVFGAATTWVERQMLETDNWVETSNELLADDEVRGALSTYLVDELYASVDVAGALEQRLPGDLAGLAGPVAAGLRDPATSAVDRLLSTGAARTVWEEANRRAHETFLAVVRDETRPGISTAEGTITLDLREIVIRLADRIGLPGVAVERIPEDVGTLVVLDSDALDAAQTGVAAVEWASVLFLVLVLGLFGAAVALAAGWRRVVVRNVGLAVLLVGVVLLFSQRIGRNIVLDGFVQVAENRSVVSQVWWIASELLRELAWGGVILGVAVVVVATLVGPSRPAVALRRRVGPLVVASPAVAGVAVVAAVVLVLAWIPIDLATSLIGLVLWVLVIVGGYVWFLRTCRDELAAGDRPVGAVTGG